jgi:hypothetical protein
MCDFRGLAHDTTLAPSPALITQTPGGEELEKEKGKKIQGNNKRTSAYVGVFTIDAWVQYSNLIDCTL